MSFNVVTDNTGDVYPWRQLKDLCEELSIQLQVVEAALTSQELEGNVTRLQVLGEPVAV